MKETREVSSGTAVGGDFMFEEKRSGVKAVMKFDRDGVASRNFWFRMADGSS